MGGNRFRLEYGKFSVKQKIREVTLTAIKNHAIFPADPVEYLSFKHIHNFTRKGSKQCSLTIWVYNSFYNGFKLEILWRYILSLERETAFAGSACENLGWREKELFLLLWAREIQVKMVRSFQRWGFRNARTIKLYQKQVLTVSVSRKPLCSQKQHISVLWLCGAYFDFTLWLMSCLWRSHHILLNCIL